MYEWESPINVAMKQLDSQIENDILNVCQEISVDIDKERLIQILKDSQHEYNRGFKNGLKHARENDFKTVRVRNKNNGYINEGIIYDKCRNLLYVSSIYPYFNYSAIYGFKKQEKEYLAKLEKKKEEVHMRHQMEIKKVEFKKSSAVVFWKDGATVVVRYENEELDREKCLAMAVLCKRVGIERIIFNNPLTIAIWLNGDKNIVKCENEDFDEQKGFAMVVSKYILGDNKTKSNYLDKFKKWCK